MKRIKVHIDFEVPDNITDEEFEEWFRYKVINYDGCSCDNPLIDADTNKLVSFYNIWSY